MTVNFGRYSPSSVRELTLDTPPRGRVNYVTNPSFESNTTGWFATQSPAVQSTDYSLFGNNSYKVTMSSTTDSNIGAIVVNVPKTGIYTFSAYVYVAGSTLAGRNVSANVEAGNATRSVVSYSEATLVADTWVRCSVTYNVTSLGVQLNNVGSMTFVLRLSGALNTATGQNIYIDGVLLERSDKAGDYFDGTLYANGHTVEPRWNMIGNPSFEQNTTGWGLGSGSTTLNFAVNTTVKYHGASSMSITAAAGGTGIVQYTNRPVIPGATYTFSFWVQGSGPCRARLVFLNSGLTSIGTYNGTSDNASSSQWTQRTVTATAPANSAWVYCQLYIDAISTGVTFYIDAALLERSPTVNEFIDRETYANNIIGTTSWGPTTNNSISLVEYVSTNTDWTIAPTFAAGNGIGSIVPQSVSVTGTNSRALINPIGTISFYDSETISVNGAFSASFRSYLIIVNYRLNNSVLFEQIYTNIYYNGPLSGNYGLSFNLRSNAVDGSTTLNNHQRLDSVNVAARTTAGLQPASQGGYYMAPIVYLVSNPAVAVETPILRHSVEIVQQSGRNSITAQDVCNTVVASRQTQSSSFDGFSLIAQTGYRYSGTIQIYGIEA